MHGLFQNTDTSCRQVIVVLLQILNLHCFSLLCFLLMMSFTVSKRCRFSIHKGVVWCDSWFVNHSIQRTHGFITFYVVFLQKRTQQQRKPVRMMPATNDCDNGDASVWRMGEVALVFVPSLHVVCWNFLLVCICKLLRVLVGLHDLGKVWLLVLKLRLARLMFSICMLMVCWPLVVSYDAFFLRKFLFPNSHCCAPVVTFGLNASGWSDSLSLLVSFFCKRTWLCILILLLCWKATPITTCVVRTLVSFVIFYCIFLWPLEIYIAHPFLFIFVLMHSYVVTHSCPVLCHGLGVRLSVAEFE